MINKKLTITDITEILGVERTTVIRWITEGMLPAEKDGKEQTSRYLVNEDDLQKFILTDHYFGHPEKINDRVFRRMPCIEDCWPVNLLRAVLDSERHTPEDEQVIDIWDINIRSFENVIGMLTDREKRIISLRYQYGLTQSEIAVAYGLTKERMRQIFAIVYRKLLYRIKKDTFQIVSKDEYDQLSTEYTRLQVQFRELQEKYAYHNSETMNERPYLTLENVRIETMDLSVRAYNCLKRAGLDTLEDILQFDRLQELPANSKDYGRKHNWMNVRNLGRKSLVEIAYKVYSMCGYKLRYYNEEGYHDIIPD